MKLFGSRPVAASSAITTAMPSVTGNFIDNPQLSALGDFKVKIADVKGQAWSENPFVWRQVDSDRVWELLQQASGGDAMVTMHQIDAILPTLNRNDRWGMRRVRARVEYQAWEQTRGSSAAVQALAQYNLRAQPVITTTFDNERVAGAAFNDKQRLQALQITIGTPHPQELPLAAIAAAFPGNAAIEGAVAALSKQKSTLASTVTTRIAALEKLEANSELRTRDVERVGFDERKDFYGRAHEPRSSQVAI